MVFGQILHTIFQNVILAADSGSKVTGTLIQDEVKKVISSLEQLEQLYVVFICSFHYLFDLYMDLFVCLVGWLVGCPFIYTLTCPSVECRATVCLLVPLCWSVHQLSICMIDCTVAMQVWPGDIRCRSHVEVVGIHSQH